MTYWPIFWDIETTGLNPLAQEFWSGEMEAQVTAVGLGTIRNWDRGPGPNNADLQVEVVWDSSEYRLLNVLSDRVRALDFDGEPFLVGYNSRNFDHPYIGARYSRLRQNGEPFTSEWKRLDMMRVAGKDNVIGKRYPKEGEYADALGVEVEDPYDGSDMPEAFQNEDWDAIKTHVEADVEESMRMFLKRPNLMMNHFFDHYDIDAEGSPVEEVDLEVEEHGPSDNDSALIEEIDLLEDE
jgi:DNA polymerase elongation subunit (family B)